MRGFNRVAKSYLFGTFLLLVDATVNGVPNVAVTHIYLVNRGSIRVLLSVVKA